ncbi:uncharacterized protein LOC128879776 [Hylaeus volcanicus]|uniref:uncharacterized protein LOC128879776 n=1 Tax=Hylaeus volcanicus TaxID=313075 RepID=UPI0023B7DB9D|nr:uncharacterized protein LOC128879776 [Hylaeus volcanicus]
MVGDSPDIVGEGSVSDQGDVERWQDNPGVVALSFALFGCFLLNVILLLAFLVRPSLRTISNRFVMNLTVSNLLVCAIMNPLLIMDTSTPSGSAQIVRSAPVGSICAISEGAIAVVTTSSVLSVLLIAIDQYFAVVDPLRYRARVDKLKCGILIMSTWLISIIFGLLAFFNPDPRGFWLSCGSRNVTWSPNVTSYDPAMTESSSLSVLESEIAELNVSGLPEILETVESIRIDDDLDLIENTTVIFDTLIGGTITYGFVYALLYAIFAYFIPFAAVCWIYVSIYAAAHRNSERARRSGSRPILSSASFSEEHNGLSRLQRLQTDTIEDFRKLPKISSLSSIDETSETMQPTGQVSRKRSFSSSMELEVPLSPGDDQASSGIVFTVGLQKLEVSEEKDRESLKASHDSILEGLVGKSPQGRSNQEQTSPQDGLTSERGDTWLSRTFEEASDSEDDARFVCFHTLDVLDKRMFLINRKVSPSFGGYQSSLKNPLKVAAIIEEGDKASEAKVDLEPKESEVATDEACADDRASDYLVQVEMDLESQDGQSRIFQGLLEDKSQDVIISNEPENLSNNKTERDTTAASNAAEPSTGLLTPIVTITPAPNKNEGLHRVSSVRSTSSYISTLKDRISNGSIFRHREETRAARISALVIVMGLICWSPYVILLILKNLPQAADQRLSHKYDVMASSFLVLAAYVSPLLFGYRSKRVKRELRRFFCFRRELSYKNNRSLMAKKVLKRRHSSTLSHLEMDHKYNIFNCVYGRNRWPKEKVQFVQVPDTALAVETCRSSFSSGASTQISSTSTEEC